MKPSSDLFELIKSLTKNEKRYFKRFCRLYSSGKENNYLKLFDAIDKQNSYDEKKIKEKFRNEKFVAQLNVTKNYLYKIVLRSLRVYNERSIAENSIAETAIEVDILARKRLFKSSEKLLKRASSLAKKEENYIMQLELSRLNRQLLITGARPDIGKLSKLLENEKEIFNNISIYNNNLLVETKLAYYIAKIGNSNGKEAINKYYITSINNIIKELILVELNESKSIKNKFLYIRICIQYYEFIGNYEVAYNYSIHCISLFKKNLEFKKNNWVYYIGILYNHTWICFRNGQIQKAQLTVNEIETEFINKKKLFRNVYIKVFLGLFELKIYLFNITGYEFIKFKEYNDTTMKIIETEKGLDSYRVIGIYLYLAINYFMHENYTKSLEFLNILNNKYPEDVYLNLKISSTVILCLIHHELQNYYYTDELVRKSVRFFNKNNYQNPIELMIMKSIYKIQNCETEKEKIELFKDLKYKILNDSRNEMYVGNLKEFDIISWIESKIEKRPFKEIIIEKANKLLK